MNYRNKKLLALAKMAPICFRCGNHNDGTVVAAHANMQSMGKGIGIKAADIPAFVCARCHDEIDGRVKSSPSFSSSSFYRSAEWALAAVKTMRWVLENHDEVFHGNQTSKTDEKH